ncbi:MAG: PDZ domain-containing protein [Anaerolineae bacterium]|nr:PDZ domain-containing protein [Anaerolineae bacterium]
MGSTTTIAPLLRCRRYRRPLIDQLLAERATRPPRLGAAIAALLRHRPTLVGSRHCCITIAIQAPQAAKKGIQLPDGAYVGRVDPGSVAALAGVQPGDVIVQLAGQAVQRDQDVDRIMANVRPGQTVGLLAWRNGQTIKVTVRL